MDEHSGGHEVTSQMAEIDLEEKMDAAMGTEEPRKSRKSRRLKKLRKLMRLSTLRDISWTQLLHDLKIWMKHPLNVGLVFWCVLACAAFVLSQLVSWHALDGVITNSETRDQWEETCHQILNALFVLMCLVWHPSFCRSTFKVYRWSDKDVNDLRAEYSSGGGPKPNERIHILIVLIFAHLTCIFTYAYAAVYWVYKMGERPTFLVLWTLMVSFFAPIIGFLYHIFSPLGQATPKDPALEDDGSSLKSGVESLHMDGSKPSFDSECHRVVSNPQWAGSVCGCFSNPPLCCLTLCCFFYVFGSTLQRLGFGNKYAQALTFFLVVFGPYFIFALSTTSISNSHMRAVLLWMGFALGAFGGLVFGACWRIVIRETFKLPPSRWCLWSSRATDFMTWFLCGCCAACQEARTSKQYDGAINGSFFVVVEDDDPQPDSLPSEAWQHHVHPPPAMDMNG